MRYSQKFSACKYKTLLVPDKGFINFFNKIFEQHFNLLILSQLKFTIERNSKLNQNV